MARAKQAKRVAGAKVLAHLKMVELVETVVDRQLAAREAKELTNSLHHGVTLANGRPFRPVEVVKVGGEKDVNVGSVYSWVPRPPGRPSLDGERATPRKAGQVELELGQLSNTACETEKLVGELIDRLESVLRPESANAQGGNPPPDSVLVPRADVVRSMRKRATKLNERLQDLLDRLEL